MFLEYGREISDARVNLDSGVLYEWFRWVFFEHV